MFSLSSGLENCNLAPHYTGRLSAVVAATTSFLQATVIPFLGHHDDVCFIPPSSWKSP